MQPPATKSQLLELELLDRDIAGYLKAAEAEPWPVSITKDAKSFKALVAVQKKHTRILTKHFKDFANNEVVGAVDWTQYRQEQARLEALNAKQAAEFSIDINVVVMEQQEKTLLKVILDLLFDGVSVGVTAGDRLYKQPADIESIVDVAEQQASKYGATLAKGINSTTANKIQASIAKSLSLGEDVKTAAKRLRGTINSPVRAQMIAHTESVNAYGGGINNYGIKTKAKGKVLSVVMDKRTSTICRELHDKYGTPAKAIPVNQPFVWTGGSSSAPGFHVFCRTGEYLLY